MLLEDEEEYNRPLFEKLSDYCHKKLIKPLRLREISSIYDRTCI